MCVFVYNCLATEVYLIGKLLECRCMYEVVRSLHMMMKGGHRQTN